MDLAQDAQVENQNHSLPWTCYQCSCYAFGVQGSDDAGSQPSSGVHVDDASAARKVLLLITP